MTGNPAAGQQPRQTQPPPGAMGDHIRTRAVSPTNGRPGGPPGPTATNPSFGQAMEPSTSSSNLAHQQQQPNSLNGLSQAAPALAPAAQVQPQIASLKGKEVKRGLNGDGAPPMRPSRDGDEQSPISPSAQGRRLLEPGAPNNMDNRSVSPAAPPPIAYPSFSTPPTGNSAQFDSQPTPPPNGIAAMRSVSPRPHINGIMSSPDGAISDRQAPRDGFHASPASPSRAQAAPNPTRQNQWMLTALAVASQRGFLLPDAEGADSDASAMDELASDSQHMKLVAMLAAFKSELAIAKVRLFSLSLVMLA